MNQSHNTAYDFSFESINPHEVIDLLAFKGQVILLVNVASRCGFTKQYKALQALYQAYQAKGVVVIGVPSNDFGKQEPGDSEQIKTFCALNFGVTFPLTSKTHVRGKNAHPFYQWAKKQKGFLATPKWNFHKYLINQTGELVDYFSSLTAPDNRKIVNAIDQLLANNLKK